jgi:hypothetical protein
MVSSSIVAVPVFTMSLLPCIRKAQYDKSLIAAGLFGLKPPLPGSRARLVSAEARWGERVICIFS